MTFDDRVFDYFGDRFDRLEEKMDKFSECALETRAELNAHVSNHPKFSGKIGGAQTGLAVILSAAVYGLIEIAKALAGK